MRYELLQDDRVSAINVETLLGDRIRIGILFIEAFSQSPIVLQEFRFAIPKELVNQSVPRLAIEMEFDLLENAGMLDQIPLC